VDWTRLGRAGRCGPEAESDRENDHARKRVHCAVSCFL
jgi:hypothetical protein